MQAIEVKEHWEVMQYSNHLLLIVVVIFIIGSLF